MKHIKDFTGFLNEVFEQKQTIIAYVLPIGVVNILSGKTMYDWSIYESPTSGIFLTSSHRLLYATPDTFEVGDNVEFKGNDSGRSVGKATIVDTCACNKEEVLKMLKKNGFDYYPIRAFTRRPAGNKTLSTSYSIKGTEYKK